MITLRWHQATDLPMQAQHGDWLLTIDRAPNWTRKQNAMLYDYHASGYQGSTRHDLGTHTDSKIAREKCAEFINTKTTEGVTT